jgi:hypothetical protein
MTASELGCARHGVIRQRRERPSRERGFVYLDIDMARDSRIRANGTPGGTLGPRCRSLLSQRYRQPSLGAPGDP